MMCGVGIIVAEAVPKIIIAAASDIIREQRLVNNSRYREQ